MQFKLFRSRRSLKRHYTCQNPDMVYKVLQLMFAVYHLSRKFFVFLFGNKLNQEWYICHNIYTKLRKELCYPFMKFNFLNIAGDYDMSFVTQIVFGNCLFIVRYLIWPFLIRYVDWLGIMSNFSHVLWTASLLNLPWGPFFVDIFFNTTKSITNNRFHDSLPCLMLL